MLEERGENYTRRVVEGFKTRIRITRSVLPNAQLGLYGYINGPWPQVTQLLGRGSCTAGEEGGRTKAQCESLETTPYPHLSKRLMEQLTSQTSRRRLEQLGFNWEVTGR